MDLKTSFLASATSIISQLFPLSPIIHHEELLGGYSGAKLVKVETADAAYVVRLMDQESAHHHAQEIACQEIASRQGYGPECFFADVNKGIIVMEYVQPSAPPQGKERLQKLIELLHKMHQGEAFPVTRSYFSYMDSSLEFLASLNQKAIDIELVKHIRHLIEDTVGLYPASAPCHRDLSRRNLLYRNGKFVLIDYEAASQDDPYIDLATICLFYNSTHEQDLFVLTKYLERPPKTIECAKLSLMKQAVCLFYGLECLRFVPVEILQTMPDFIATEESLAQDLKSLEQGAEILSDPETLYRFALNLIGGAVRNYETGDMAGNIRALPLIE